MRTISFHTLGCKMNQAETLRMEETAALLGLKKVDFKDNTDIAVINTCTVTQVADKKSRQTIRSLLNRCKKLIITGCFINMKTDAEDIFKSDKIIVLRDKAKFEGTIKILIKDSYGPVATGPNQNPRLRANLIVQNGCNNFCSYCIVPYARGREISYPVGEILGQAREYAGKGIKELVVTGINTGANKDLPLLLKEISAIDSILRVRISSVEPLNISDALLKELAGNEKICRHLHIPLQSGDDNVLKAMNRKYLGDDYKKVVERIRRKVPGMAVSTDVIVGFPGETEKQFSNTVKMCRDIGFSRIHVFRFSPRPGTPASKMEEKVPSKEISARAEVMKSLRSELMLKYHENLNGRSVEVLVEQRNKKNRRLEGLTSDYVRVFTDGEDGLIGSMVPVLIEKAEIETVEGRSLRGGRLSDRRSNL
jgi:threonylcarbamoyladenosine tRNA methylthiotransferase MtaB